MAGAADLVEEYHRRRGRFWVMLGFERLGLGEILMRLFGLIFKLNFLIFSVYDGFVSFNTPGKI